VQVTGPEVASLPVQLIVTWWLYHPFESGLRAGAAELATGGVESYLSGKEVEAELPAWSVQVTPGAALALSGPLYVVELGQLAIPEVASLPCQLTVTELLYQPFAFGLRSGLGANIGGVESYLSGKETDAELPA
jgi:hypothetical protein